MDRLLALDRLSLKKRKQKMTLKKIIAVDLKQDWKWLKKTGIALYNSIMPSIKEGTPLNKRQITHLKKARARYFEAQAKELYKYACLSTVYGRLKSTIQDYFIKYDRVCELPRALHNEVVAANNSYLGIASDKEEAEQNYKDNQGNIFCALSPDVLVPILMLATKTPLDLLRVSWTSRVLREFIATHIGRFSFDTRNITYGVVTKLVSKWVGHNYLLPERRWMKGEGLCKFPIEFHRSISTLDPSCKGPFSNILWKKLESIKLDGDNIKLLKSMLPRFNGDRLISGCPNLRSLELSLGLNINDATLALFAKLGDEIRKLKLSYPDSKEPGETQQYLERLLTQFPKLNSLEINCAEYFHSEHIIALEKLISPSLESLIINRGRFNFRVIPEKVYPRIEKLRLNSKYFKSEDLYKMVGAMPNLRSLSFHRSYRNDPNHYPVNLVKLINPNLSVLKIQGCDCQLPLGGSYPGLTSLDLRYTNVTVRWLLYIRGLFPNLKYLKLGMTKEVYDYCIGINLVNKLSHLGEIDMNLYLYQIEVNFK